MTRGIGQLLRQLRQGRGLTLERAAQAAGLSRSAVNRWETNVALPRLTELNALLEALGAGPQQKRTVIAQMDVPRAQRQVRAEVHRIAEQVGIGPKPSGGDLLRALRMRGGLSLDAVAERMGVTVRTLRRWEKAEVWPSTEQLHTLCYLLKACEEEMIALTCGAFAAKPVADALTKDVLEEQTRLFLDQYCSPGVAYALAELEFFALEAKAWPLAAKEASCRPLLANLYARHGYYLSTIRRYGEADDFAQRALALMPPDFPSADFWLYAGIASAQADVYRSNTPTPNRGIDQLREWFPLTSRLHYKAWILADLAIFEALRGETEIALQLVEQSCQTAARFEHTNDLELRLRELDKAKILLMVGRPQEALELLRSHERFFTSINRVEADLLEAEAYFEVKALSEAHYWLQRALVSIEKYHLPHMLGRAEALAARF